MGEEEADGEADGLVGAVEFDGSGVGEFDDEVAKLSEL